MILNDVSALIRLSGFSRVNLHKGFGGILTADDLPDTVLAQSCSLRITSRDVMFTKDPDLLSSSLKRTVGTESQTNESRSCFFSSHAGTHRLSFAFPLTQRRIGKVKECSYYIWQTSVQKEGGTDALDTEWLCIMTYCLSDAHHTTSLAISCDHSKPFKTAL